MFSEEIKELRGVAVQTRDRILFEVIVCLVATVAITVFALIPISILIKSIISILLSGIIYFVCRREFNDAVISVFQMQPSNDVYNVFALFLNVVHSISLIFISNINSHLFSPVIFLSITISMIMKWVFANELIKNINFADNNKVYLVETGDVNLRQRFVEQVCMVNPIIRFPDMVGITYSEDPSENKNRKFAPFILIVSVVLSFIPLIVRGVNPFFTSIVALLAVAASFTGEMTFVLPYLVVQFKLRRLGSILLGYHSLTSLKEIDTLMVKDSELFPKEGIKLEKIQINSVDNTVKAVEYTAAVFLSQDAPESKAFMDLVKFDKAYLPKPDNVITVGGQGYIAEFGMDKVFIGNRDLLFAHGLSPYSQSKEAFMSTGGSLMYCVVNKVLSASYMFSYKCDENMKASAEKMVGEFRIIVDTQDCNITENMIKKQYDLKNTTIVVPNAEEIDRIKQLRNDLEVNDTPCIISSDRSIGIMESVRHAKNLFVLIDYAILFNQIGIGLGILLTLLSVIMFPALISAWWILCYNLLWTMPIVILSCIKSRTAK